MAGFGSLNPAELDPEVVTPLEETWQDREAQAALEALKLNKPPARSWYDTINDVAHFPHRMFGQLTSARPDDPAKMMPENYVYRTINNTADALAGAIKSGVTAPGDAVSGELPMTDAEGHTSPEAISRGFDLASIAGGGSVAGTAGQAVRSAGTDFRVLGRKIGGEADPASAIKITPVSELAAPYHAALEGGTTLASDSAKPGAVIAGLHHTATPEFRNWFGESRAVNADGSPAVVYHGAPNYEHAGGKLGDFDVFDRLATTRIVKGRQPGMDSVGSWFSDLPGDKGAGMYAGAEKGSIYPVHLSVKNPWEPKDFNQFLERLHEEAGSSVADARKNRQPLGRVDPEPFREWMKSQGYDGIKFPKGAIDSPEQSVWVALEPNQIKSAIGNSGKFDPANPSILASDSGKAGALMAGFGSLLAYDPMTGLPIGAEPGDDSPFAPVTKPSPGPEMRAYHPTVSERVGNVMQDALMGLGADPYRAGHIAHGVRDLMQWSPLGIPMAAGDMKHSMDQGDVTGTVLGAASLIPGAKPLAKAASELKPLVASSEHALPYHDLLEPPSELAYNALHGYPDEAAAGAKAAALDTGAVAGPSGGAEGFREAQLQAERRAGSRKPLEGLPQGPQRVAGEDFIPGPVASVHDVADRYMADKDFGSYFKTPEKYHPLDPEHSAAIARAFDEMKHTPNDLATKNSYDALVKETLAQYQAIKESGLKITPTNGETYPYHGNPREVAKDVADNNHMAFFKTDEAGFGSDPTSGIDLRKHPMMQPSGETLNGEPLLNNDLFRIVHDYFGHIKNGYGFRAAGEDNAWRSHAAMYSDLARPAMTTETRGQNSWVNYGPHGEFNRTASGADTKYADQKVGLLPEWVMRDRGSPEPIVAYQGGPHAFSQYDMSKIGTGEGAQAYGHGAYSAENPEVAKMYREQLSANRAWEKNGEPMPWHHVAEDMVQALNGARAARPFPDNTPLHPDQSAQMVGYLTRRMEGGKSLAAIRRNFEPPVGFEPEWNALLEHAKQYRYNKNPGHTYEMAIDHPPEKFLDYDKPFSQQSDYVRERVSPMIEEQRRKDAEFLQRMRNTPGVTGVREDLPPVDPSGREIYEKIAGPQKNRSEGRVNSSAKLKELGIPGIRYLDGQSRGKSSGTHNYVTFDAPRILKRYAIPGAIGAGGFGSLAPGEEQ